MEHISVGGVAVFMAFIGNVGALFYHAGKVGARLEAVENAINNGLMSAVSEHGEDIASIQATCKAHHGAEI